MTLYNSLDTAIEEFPWTKVVHGMVAIKALVVIRSNFGNLDTSSIILGIVAEDTRTRLHFSKASRDLEVCLGNRAAVVLKWANYRYTPLSRVYYSSCNPITNIDLVRPMLWLLNQDN
jgi:hypothetical protein